MVWGRMRRDITDRMCQRECADCPLQGVTPGDCPGDCMGCSYSEYCPCGNRFIHPQFDQLAGGQARSAQAQEISIEHIRRDTPKPPVAEYDKGMIRMLARVLKVLGQPRPLIVKPQKGNQLKYRIVGGMDILLGAIALGWKNVSAQVIDLDDHEAAMQFYRAELLRLDLSWEDQARCVLAIQDLYHERHPLPPSLATLSTLSGLSPSRTRDLLHGITLLKKHRLSDGTIPFPTLLRSVRLTYPEAMQRELIRGLVDEEWTRRRATSHATSRIRKQTLNVVGQDDGNSSGNGRPSPVSVNRVRQLAQVVPPARVGVGGR
ncbi:MAG: hypothetical protein EPO21_03975 [Chloroflexota bacterium]|nr:MAG: hypothetical protein EPO21_03975 [Chloroflexota bacterium]